jgi:hypothetical protein
MDYKPLVVPTGQEWKAPGSFGALKLYAVSKLVRSHSVGRDIVPALKCFHAQGNAIVAREMARRYGDVLVSIAVHPGATCCAIRRSRILTTGMQVPLTPKYRAKPRSGWSGSSAPSTSIRHPTARSHPSGPARHPRQPYSTARCVDNGAEDTQAYV